MSREPLTIPPQVMARRVGSETVILDLNSGMYFGLDEVGARVWELIGSGGSIDSICEILVREYDVTPEKLRQDVTRLVEDLRARGLVGGSGVN